MKISIIIPVYNTSKYIDNCIKSCISQSFDDYEIILIDDGSTDGSSKKCDEWANSNSIITTYHFDNAGAATARNRGIEKSQGEYICFVDSDDTIDNNYLNYLWNLVSVEKADVAVCRFLEIYNGKVPEKKEKSNSKPIVFSGIEAMENLLYQRYFISSPCAFISKRELWDSLKFPDGRRVEDVATMYKMYVNANKVVYGENKLYHRYHWPDSTIYTTYSIKNREYIAHCRDIVMFLKDKYPAYVKCGYHRMFSACFQILSETAKSKENQEFIKDIYKEIRGIRKAVMMDSKARIRNRGAALLSYISIDILHIILRSTYIIKISMIKV